MNKYSAYSFPGMSAIAFDHNPRYLRQWERASRRDSLYFEKHPNRTHRLRKPYKGELEFWKAKPHLPRHPDDDKNHPGYRAYVLVTQLQPESRERRIAYLYPGAPDDEELAHALALIKEEDMDNGRITANTVQGFMEQLTPKTNAIH